MGEKEGLTKNIFQYQMGVVRKGGIVLVRSPHFGILEGLLLLSDVSDDLR
jgi:hypothetical protein